MKEDRFLNVPGEIPILTNDETNQLKGGFKKIKTNPSVRMDSGDKNISSFKKVIDDLSNIDSKENPVFSLQRI